jgi:drug/metabolite transporter (DMT)-like permease
MQKHSIAGLFAGLGAAAIWGGMYVVSKVVLDVIPPFALLTIRLVMGAAVLGLVIYFRKNKPVFTKEQFWKSLLVGFVGYGISLGFQFVGTKLSTASNGSLVTSATPAFVLIFAPFLLGEKTTTRRIIALIVSTLGVLAVIDPRNAELSPTLFWGNMSLLSAALTWALYSVLVRKVSQSGDLLTSSAVMLLGGCHPASHSVFGKLIRRESERSPSASSADYYFWGSSQPPSPCFFGITPLRNYPPLWLRSRSLPSR